jgi:hypothetical protein
MYNVANHHLVVVSIGPFPCLSSLTRLAQLYISANAFTSMPDCALSGSVSSFVSIRAATNQIASISTLFGSMVNQIHLIIIHLDVTSHF